MAKLTVILFCFICFLVNVCCTGESMLHLDFMLSVTTVGQHAPKNVTIRCSVHDKQQDSKDVCGFNISGTIIMKYHENDWSPIARICETGQVAESLSGHPDIKGLISDHKSLYLEIKWLNAGPEVFGHYKCVANYQNNSSVRDVLSSKATLDNVIAWNPIQVVEKEFDVFFSMCTVNTTSVLNNQLKNKTTTLKNSITEGQTVKNDTDVIYQNVTDLEHIEGDVTLKTWFKQNKSERLSNSVNYFTRKADLLKQHFESQLETLKVNFRTFYQDECSESFRDWQPAVESIENFIIDLKKQILNDQLKINQTVQKYISLHSNNQDSVRKFCFSLDEKISTQQNISNNKISELSANVFKNQQDIKSIIQNNDQINQTVIMDKAEHNNQLQMVNITISETTKGNVERFEKLHRKMIQFFDKSNNSIHGLLNKVNDIETILNRLENSENHQKNKIREIENKHTQYVGSVEQRFEDVYSTLNKSIKEIKKVFGSLDEKILTQQNISNNKIFQLSANVSRNQQDLNSTISSVIQNNKLQAYTLNDQGFKIEEIIKENNNTILMTKLLTQLIDQINQSVIIDKNEHSNRLQIINNTTSEMTKDNVEKFENLNMTMIQYFDKCNKESNHYNNSFHVLLNKVNNIEILLNRLDKSENHQKNKISEIENKHTQYVVRSEQRFEDVNSTLNKFINEIKKVFERIEQKLNKTSIDQNILRHNYSSDIIEIKEKSKSLNESLNSFRSTYHNLEKSLKQWQADVVEQMKNVSGLISDLRLNTLAIEEINKTLNYITTGEWPEGQFSLLKPISGCPGSSIQGWREGYRRYHTETYNNYDNYSTHIHLQPPMKTKMNGNSFFTLTFCVKTFQNSYLSWPNGTYCINRKGGSCPGGFQSGYVEINEEQIQTVSEWGREETDDIKTNVLYFCCRNDRSPLTPIVLPRSSPFYLYRYGDYCQQVDGMKVVQEFIHIDTDDANTNKGEGGKHPVFNLPDVRIFLCYYE